MGEVSWDRVKELFHQVVDLDRQARSDFLDDACGGDQALRQEVESLVAASAGATAALGSPVQPREGAGMGLGEAVGDQIGAYRLVRRLGAGGMGVVYLGERADGEFSQRVAIKLVRTPWVAPHLLERFRAERQILAQLQHPNIAQLLDGGTTPLGQPYLVMEHVEGEPVDLHCCRRGLSTRERLELFLGVCAAVSQAHRQLVVHRDIKPSNVLVTQDGTPKLLDFGIAKLLDQGVEGPALTITEYGRALTPEYASPEQVRGKPVGTTSDVYSLGVLLYELLTGVPLYRFESSTAQEIERVVCEEPASRPSTAVVRSVQAAASGAEEAPAGRRDLSPSALRRELAGDLDTVVLTALAKEPERRYRSVDQLAEDIRRHLDGRPITARPETLGYVARKFVRRHRVGVAVAAGVTLVVLAFGIAMAVLAARLAAERSHSQAAERVARSEAATAQQAVHFLVDVFEGADPFTAEGGQLSARDIVELASRRVREELSDQPAVAATLLDAVGRVYNSLADFERGEELLQEALALRLALVGGEHLQTAAVLNSLGELHRHRGELVEAERLHRQALEIRRQAEADEELSVAESLNNLGLVLQFAGRLPEAETKLAQALELRRSALGEGHPQVAISLSNMALLRRFQGRYQEASELYQRVLISRERSLGPEHPLVANSLQGLGQSLSSLGRLEEAESHLRRALEIRRRALGGEHPLTAVSVNDLAALLHDQGRRDGAEAFYREALALHQRIRGPDHVEVAVTANNFAMLLHDQGRNREAEELLRRSLAIRRATYGEEHPAVARAKNNLARALVGRGEAEEAEELFRRALELRRGLLRADHPEVADSKVGLGWLLVERGEAHQAEPLLRTALEIRQATFGAAHWRTGEAESALAHCLRALGHGEEAQPLLDSGLAILLETLGPDHPTTRRAEG